jgi:hypothetical protein
MCSGGTPLGGAGAAGGGESLRGSAGSADGKAMDERKGKEGPAAREGSVCGPSESAGRAEP